MAAGTQGREAQAFLAGVPLGTSLGTSLCTFILLVGHQSKLTCWQKTAKRGKMALPFL